MNNYESYFQIKTPPEQATLGPSEHLNKLCLHYSKRSRERWGTGKPQGWARQGPLLVCPFTHSPKDLPGTELVGFFLCCSKARTPLPLRTFLFLFQTASILSGGRRVHPFRILVNFHTLSSNFPLYHNSFAVASYRAVILNPVGCRSFRGRTTLLEELPETIGKHLYYDLPQ